MPRFTDLTGKKFGRLTALSRDGHSGKRIAWQCLCDCGKSTRVATCDLTNGHTTSCGCWKVESNIIKATRHGHAGHGTRTGTYTSWSAMLTRCNNPKVASYKDYGGRGIKVCERWHKFENFLADMGERPQGMTLDRERGNEGYEPGNCRWATKVTQNSNTRRNNTITYQGAQMTQAAFARLTGVSESVVSFRLIQGDTPEAIAHLKSCPHCGGQLPRQERKKRKP